MLERLIRALTRQKKSTPEFKAESKRRRFPFIFNETSCGPVAACQLTLTPAEWGTSECACAHIQTVFFFFFGLKGDPSL